MMPVLIRRALHAWFNWRDRNAIAKTHARLLKRSPRLRELDAAEERARRQHGPVRQIQAARKDTMTELLKGAGR